MYSSGISDFSAMIWEDTIWLSNGAQIPIKDVIIDSVTGRIYRTVAGDDTKKDSTDPYRWVSGHTTDITDLLTFDERNALRASAKAYDLGSRAPARGISSVGWAAIAGGALLLTVYISTR
jgi:hypothetical protein